MPIETVCNTTVWRELYGARTQWISLMQTNKLFRFLLQLNFGVCNERAAAKVWHSWSITYRSGSFASSVANIVEMCISWPFLSEWHQANHRDLSSTTERKKVWHDKRFISLPEIFSESKQKKRENKQTVVVKFISICGQWTFETGWIRITKVRRHSTDASM